MIKDKMRTLLCIFCIMLISCENKIHNGKIVSKMHHPARIYSEKTRGSLTKSKRIHEDEEWILKVENSNDSEIITGYFFTTKDIWDSLSEGDHFSDSTIYTIKQK